MRFFIFFFFITSQAFALPEDFWRSASFGFTGVNSTSQLQTASRKDVLDFSPEVPAGTSLSVETKFITIGYTFAGKAERKGNEKTEFKDVRLSFAWRSFDVRLNYQAYKGAEVDGGGKKAFYNDYEVKAYNARVHYYFQGDYLKFIRDGAELVSKASTHKGFSAMGSTFAGVNIDRRRISLPDNLISEHQSQISKYGIEYDRTFEALSAGPLIGADLMAQFGTGFARGKFGGGPAIQTGGTTVPQFELALGTGVAFFQRHLLAAAVDVYMLGFKDKDDDQRINNNNNQVNLTYTYSF